MRRFVFLLLPLWLVGADVQQQLRLVIVDPAHFHAAQLHTHPLPGFARDAWLFAPLGRDVAGYWSALAQLTSRDPQGDYWRFHSYIGDDYLQRWQTGNPGDVLVLSGRNQRKIEYLEAGLRAGMHALVDKPWIIEASQFPRLQTVLDEAEHKGLVVYDCMTQRLDIAYQLQRELVNDRAVFGDIQAGSPQQPAVEMRSSHVLLKTLNGSPNLRPAWYFDIAQQGEALADVGTHVVDLAHWTLFPDQALDFRKDLSFVSARRWPTVISLQQFQRVTGESQFPDYLASAVRNGQLFYYTNGSVLYQARGIHISLQVTWEYESPGGSRDSMLAIYRGTRAEVAVRAGREQNYRPEVDITPLEPSNRTRVKTALEARLRALDMRYPGLTIAERGDRLQIIVPESLRTPDVDYFQLLAKQVAAYINHPGSLPAWEKPNLLAKYYVTTHAVELARATGGSRP